MRSSIALPLSVIHIARIMGTFKCMKGMNEKYFRLYLLQKDTYF